MLQLPRSGPRILLLPRAAQQRDQAVLQLRRPRPRQDRLSLGRYAAVLRLRRQGPPEGQLSDGGQGEKVLCVRRNRPRQGRVCHGEKGVQVPKVWRRQPLCQGLQGDDDGCCCFGGWCSARQDLLPVQSGRSRKSCSPFLKPPLPKGENTCVKGAMLRERERENNIIAYHSPCLLSPLFRPLFGPLHKPSAIVLVLVLGHPLFSIGLLLLRAGGGFNPDRQKLPSSRIRDHPGCSRFQRECRSHCLNQKKKGLSLGGAALAHPLKGKTREQERRVGGFIPCWLVLCCLAARTFSIIKNRVRGAFFLRCQNSK